MVISLLPSEAQARNFLRRSFSPLTLAFFAGRFTLLRAPWPVFSIAGRPLLSPAGIYGPSGYVLPGCCFFFPVFQEACRLTLGGFLIADAFLRRFISGRPSRFSVLTGLLCLESCGRRPFYGCPVPGLQALKPFFDRPAMLSMSRPTWPEILAPLFDCQSLALFFSPWTVFEKMTPLAGALSCSCKAYRSFCSPDRAPLDFTMTTPLDSREVL